MDGVVGRSLGDVFVMCSNPPSEPSEASKAQCRRRCVLKDDPGEWRGCGGKTHDIALESAGIRLYLEGRSISSRVLV